jgi:hypothetical protein
MRNALRQRESDLQYRKVAEHFAHLDIHPGYLAELSRDPVTPTRKIIPREPSLIPERTSFPQSLDYICFAVAFIGLIVALTTAFIYYGRTTLTSQQPVVFQSPKTDPNILRLDESVRRLSIALATVITSMQESSNTSSLENAKTVEVVVQKANLRMAATKASSAIMAVAKGTTLVVETEEEGWLRVFAPSGELLWIQRELTAETAS